MNLQKIPQNSQLFQNFNGKNSRYLFLQIKCRNVVSYEIKRRLKITYRSAESHSYFSDSWKSQSINQRQVVMNNSPAAHRSDHAHDLAPESSPGMRSASANDCDTIYHALEFSNRQYHARGKCAAFCPGSVFFDQPIDYANDESVYGHAPTGPDHRRTCYLAWVDASRFPVLGPDPFRDLVQLDGGGGGGNERKRCRFIRSVDWLIRSYVRISS